MFDRGAFGEVCTDTKESLFGNLKTVLLLLGLLGGHPGTFAGSVEPSLDPAAA